MWSSVSDLCKLSSFRYQSEQNRQHPADERLEERRKKIAEERPKKQAYHDLAVQRTLLAGCGIEDGKALRQPPPEM